MASPFRSIRTSADYGRLIVRQRDVARRYHCRLAIEMLHPRFAFRCGDLTVVLTVNSGYE